VLLADDWRQRSVGQRTCAAGREYPYGVVVLWDAMAQRTTATRGYTATKDELVAKLRRIEEQVRGRHGMVQEDRYCIDVLTRSARSGPLSTRLPLGCATTMSRHRVIGGAASGAAEERTTEMMASVGRLLRRG
jgi:CsoR family transcriptional regulator, copper-sensing transcriptional repressor